MNSHTKILITSHRDMVYSVLVRKLRFSDIVLTCGRDGLDQLAIVTDWQESQHPELDQAKYRLRSSTPVLLDGRILSELRAQ